MGQLEKILEYHMNRLKNKNIEVQLSTCQELELLGSQAEVALDALRELYTTSANEDVKRAAQRAGLAIFNAIKAEREE